MGEDMNSMTQWELQEMLDMVVGRKNDLSARTGVYDPAPVETPPRPARAESRGTLPQRYQAGRQGCGGGCEFTGFVLYADNLEVQPLVKATNTHKRPDGQLVTIGTKYSACQGCRDRLIAEHSTKGRSA